MTRGTTPTLKFTLPFQTNLIADAWITFTQNGQVVLDKTLTDCTLESTSQSTEVSRVQLYAGSTAKGNSSDFSSTSDTVVSLTTGNWTRSEIDSLTLRYTIGYYGGRMSGATLSVTYSIQIEGQRYQYTITSASEDHTINVVCGSITTHTVTTSVQNGTLISPSASETVREGESLEIRFSGNDMFEFGSLSINGQNVTPTETSGVYSYTIQNITRDTTVIAIFVKGSYIYIKLNGTWTRAKSVYKKVNGSWVLQSDVQSVFDSGVNYIYE